MEDSRRAVSSSAFISALKMEVLFFQLAARARNGSRVEGNKSRTPRGFITQAVPVLLFSARRCRNIHYMHEEFSLAARIDPASPVLQHVSITSTAFFFQKVCNEAHTVLSFLPHSQVCMLKVESRSSCSFPALQLCPAGRRSICYCIFWINMSESLWSHPTEHPQWKIFFLVKTELTFIHVVFTRTTGRMPMCSRSSGVSARRSALVTCFIWLHLSRMIWFNYFLIVRFSSCHVHQQTSVLCFCSNRTASADRGRGRQCSESTLRFSSTPETSFPQEVYFWRKQTTAASSCTGWSKSNRKSDSGKTSVFKIRHPVQTLNHPHSKII